jgi:hypothetical protein
VHIAQHSSCRSTHQSLFWCNSTPCTSQRLSFVEYALGFLLLCKDMCCIVYKCGFHQLRYDKQLFFPAHRAKSFYMYFAVLFRHHLCFAGAPLPWGTTFTTRFDPLKNSFSHAGLGVVACLVDPRLAPGFENLYFIRIVLAGDRSGCGHFG